mgnify:CR=1 FL=1|jgi:hypothetical protein
MTKYIIESQGESMIVGFMNELGELEYDVYHHADGGVFTEPEGEPLEFLLENTDCNGDEEEYKVEV